MINLYFLIFLWWIHISYKTKYAYYDWNYVKNTYQAICTLCVIKVVELRGVSNSFRLKKIIIFSSVLRTNLPMAIHYREHSFIWKLLTEKTGYMHLGFMTRNMGVCISMVFPTVLELLSCTLLEISHLLFHWNYPCFNLLNNKNIIEWQQKKEEIMLPKSGKIKLPMKNSTKLKNINK